MGKITKFLQTLNGITGLWNALVAMESLHLLCVKLNSRYDRYHSFGHQIIGNSCFTPSKPIYAAVLIKEHGGARKEYR
jgi:hypothetical protein